MAGEFVEAKSLPPQHGETQLLVIRCGERRGGHRVEIPRNQWPPRGIPRPNEPEGPQVTTACIDCQATLLVGVPVGPKVTVILTGPREERQGQILDDLPAGQVIDESEVPVGGSVIEEPEPKPRRMR